MQGRGCVAVNVRRHGLGWNVSVPPPAAQMRQTIITSTCTPSLPTKRDMHVPLCQAASSSIYHAASLPCCFQLCQKKVYLFFLYITCIYIRTLIASECIVHVIWMDTHADTYNTQGGGERSLIPCGEREEIFAYVCNNNKA